MIDPNDKFPERGPVQSKRPGGFALVFFIAILGIFIASLFRGNTAPIREISYSDFTRFVSQNQIESVVIYENNSMDIFLKGTETNGPAQLKTRIPYSDPGLLANLRDNNINVTGAPEKIGLWHVVIKMFPWVFGFALVWFMLRNMQGVGSRTFQFGKSRAKRYQDEGKKVSFTDVAGQKDAKFELEEVVEFLKNPQKFTKMGARIPKGVFLSACRVRAKR